MPKQPNILFLMTDQMQGRVFDPDHPCLTPNFDRLASGGVKIQRAYTPNAVCSPARASLMTGLLPHNHGVLEVTHCVDKDQCNLRLDKPHWAQKLTKAGYRTGYFGKWHVEHSDDPTSFGWQESTSSDRMKQLDADLTKAAPEDKPYLLSHHLEQPEGYRSDLFYAVTPRPPAFRGMGKFTAMGSKFLEDALDGSQPWCCFVSVTEPHDPFVCGEEAFAKYDPEALPLPPNVIAQEELRNQPGLYQKAGRVWSHLSDRQRREARACYYASITEIDAQFGKLIDQVEAAGELENTLIVLTSDHGELLGAHGLYCKNVSGYEEVYNIPMILRGPGVAANAVADARVGLHDLGPTLLDLTGAGPMDAPDSSSFAALLKEPQNTEEFQFGFAEYHGTRIRLTQRVAWDGDWKFVFNGFDEDELYDLKNDPGELMNLALDPDQNDRVRIMMKKMWAVIRDTGDHAMLNAHYPILRVAPFGPGILDA